MKIRNFVESDYHEIADLYYDAVHAIDTTIYTKEQLEAWAPTPPDYSFWASKLRKSRPYVAQLAVKLSGS